ncbi:uncharacterized protein Z518_11306 [Rhinocladiella mackenziei CBS 650.93]|uniref:Cyclase n=1 Tax=Rhinocladiella mackenziei CBS 650.93 TaxID=1442369 RepID=A0A0D2GMI8_9EURO|nr:uncharacterized protein Z518_11306 [Rhinocladiella mackenziei CBS 650.93]KIW99567.1 hypothetical protein Z518_11306 [Rhinocladiella mackenziei CBS 650.93]
MVDVTAIPDFDSLSPVGDLPQGCVWGLFDQNGTKDRVGCLNLLTEDVVREACKLARDGVSISLNWPLGAFKIPPFGRIGLAHNVHAFKDTPFNVHAFEDEVSFNTQGSSQWDSLVHFGHQATGLAYNGAAPSQQALLQHSDHRSSMPTLEHWHDRGCLVGRGVLLDYRAWASATGRKYNCFESHTISIQDLVAIAKHQGTRLRTGDILLIRSGYTEDLSAVNGEEQQKLLTTGRAIGVEGTVEAARWMWNHHFSAVAGDMIAFEVLPPLVASENNREGGTRDLVLHQYFLSFMGLHIGELWDLKALGEHCQKVGRYEFLLTSTPLNVPGLVGSPPNAVAIF